MNFLNIGVDAIGIFFLLCVMTLVEFDTTNTRSPLWLQWTRRSSFGIMFMLLANAIYEDNSKEAIQSLVWSGVLALGINCVDLFKRRPRKRNGKTYSSQEMRNVNIRQRIF